MVLPSSISLIFLPRRVSWRRLRLHTKALREAKETLDKFCNFYTV